MVPTTWILPMLLAAGSPQDPAPTRTEAEERWDRVKTGDSPAAAEEFLRTERRRLYSLGMRDQDRAVSGMARGRPAEFSGADRILAEYEKLDSPTPAELRQKTALRTRRELLGRLSPDEAVRYDLPYRWGAGVDSFRLTQDPAQKEADFALSLKDVQKFKDRYAEAGVLLGTAEFLQERHRHQEAIALYRSVAEYRTESGDLVGLAICRYRLGECHYWLGQYREAIRSLEESVALSTDAGNREVRTKALRIRGDLSSALGQQEDALKWYGEALAVGLPEVRSQILAGIAGANARTGRLQEAYERCQQLLSEPVDPDDSRPRITAQLILASVYEQAGDIPKAAAACDAALKLRGGADDKDDWSSSMAFLAACHMLLGDRDRATREFEEALRMSLEKGNREAEAEVLCKWGGMLLLEQGRLEDATRMLTRSVRITEELRESIGMLEREKMTWHSLHRERYALASLALLKSENVGAAMRVLEGLKSRTLGDSVRPGARRRIPPEDLRKRQQAQELLNLRSRERSEAVRALGAAAEADRPALRARFEAADAALASAEQAAGDVEHRIQLYQDTGSAREFPVTDALEEDEALLLYTMVDRIAWYPPLSRGTIVATVVTRKGTRMFDVTSPATLEDDIARLRRMAVTSAGGLPAAAYKGPARRLYAALFLDIDDYLKARKIRKITVSPDGVLYSIPFEALLASDAGSDYAELDYVLRRYQVAYAHSAYHFGKTRAQPFRKDANGFVGFGDPATGTAQGREGTRWPRLPGSGEEVRSIGAVYGTPAFLDKEATEARAHDPDLVLHARVIQFACHGFVDALDPMRSALVLASDEKYDGLLEAREIADLDLPVDLVVLSACDSGAGDLVRGEGLIGLTRAFIMAGARSILVSLWPIPDGGGRDFMVAFHKKVAAGTPPAQALSEVKSHWIRSPRTAAPFHWAGFVLHGS